MKTLMAILLVGGALSSCTTTPTTTTAANNVAPKELGNKRVHSREELERTGFQDVAQSLEAIDSSVSTPGH